MIAFIHLTIYTLVDETIRVLEIGSGWGALAILLTQKYPFVEVDSLTLSSEQVCKLICIGVNKVLTDTLLTQKLLAEQRIRDAGVESRARIWLMDYRSVCPGTLLLSFMLT